MSIISWKNTYLSLFYFIIILIFKTQYHLVAQASFKILVIILP